MPAAELIAGFFDGSDLFKAEGIVKGFADAVGGGDKS